MQVYYGGSGLTPSLTTSKIVWPAQHAQLFFFPPNLIVTIMIQYNIQTLITATAIIEWNIGVPLSSQIRQTSADRTDFAY
jgi:hypothetical protein